VIFQRFAPLALVTILTAISFSTTSFAQDNLPPKTEPVDEVIATGTLQRDKAMAAFLAGDYVTAEIEFDKNAFCALRVERNFRSGIEAARDSTVRADVGVDVNTSAQPTGGQGGASVAPSGGSVQRNFNINSLDLQKEGKIARRTCEDRGYQLYMRGLSEIKLGKLSEAKESLSRAVVLRKSIYDAYFRLALLEYQEGDMKAAKRNFKRLKNLQAKCRKCESEPEINEQVAYLQKTLG
jgi:tetratricopeptide (TPR) repeat protein